VFTLTNFRLGTHAGADYGLLDCETQTPLPDYYVSMLWSQLMGAGVLKTVVSTGPRTLRAYAHCAADTPRDNDIVVLLLNLDDQPVAVEVDAAAVGVAADAARTEWHFTAGVGGLGGPTIRLGGSELKWGGLGQPLPPMLGVTQATAAMPVKLAPQSIVFVQLPGAVRDGLC
jgi:hypothetical protein